MNKINRFKTFIIMMMLSMMFVTGCTPSAMPNDIEHAMTIQNNINDSPDSNQPGEQNLTEESPPVGQVAGDLEVHFIDVGQGDSILIKQNGHNMLIDAGENNKGGLVVDYLKGQGVETLDYVIGSHPHSDHIGGLDDVINSFAVNNVIMPEKTHTTKTFEDVVKAVKNKGLKITKPVVGAEHLLGDAKFTILGPNQKEHSNLNDYSVSVKLNYGDNSFVFTGDAEKDSEKDLIGNGIDLKADVLKAGHHGSNTSNTQDLLSKVNPKYVVIQVGAGNKYKHPNDEIVQRFENIGAEVYRNDTHGNIIAKSDGQNIQFVTSKGAQQNVVPQPEPVVAPVVVPQPEPVVVPQPEPVVAPVVVPQQAAQPSTLSFVGNTGTLKFHNSTCHHVKKIQSKIEFNTAQEAVDAGYVPCKVCHPF